VIVVQPTKEAPRSRYQIGYLRKSVFLAKTSFLLFTFGLRPRIQTWVSLHVVKRLLVWARRQVQLNILQCDFSSLLGLAVVSGFSRRSDSGFSVESITNVQYHGVKKWRHSQQKPGIELCQQGSFYLFCHRLAHATYRASFLNTISLSGSPLFVLSLKWVFESLSLYLRPEGLYWQVGPTGAAPFTVLLSSPLISSLAMASRLDEPTPIFDNLDIDLIVKVLNHTVFSQSFFLFRSMFVSETVPRSVLPLLRPYLLRVPRSQGYGSNSCRTKRLLRCSIPVLWVQSLFRLLVLTMCRVLQMVLKVVQEPREFALCASEIRLGGANCPHNWWWVISITLSYPETLISIGASGVGELLANTLAVRNVTVVVLDINPIVTENCASLSICDQQQFNVFADNITYYKCDVSKWEEVEAVAHRIREEVSTRISGAWGLLTQVQIGDPTILINNAGVVQGKLVLDLTEKDVLQWVGSWYSPRAMLILRQDLWREHHGTFLDTQSLPACYDRERGGSYCHSVIGHGNCYQRSNELVLLFQSSINVTDVFQPTIARLRLRLLLSIRHSDASWITGMSSPCGILSHYSGPT